jgi:hypothetical protein
MLDAIAFNLTKFEIIDVYKLAMVMIKHNDIINVKEKGALCTYTI